MFVAGPERPLFQPRRLVGQTGAVIGVDLAKELLELARTKAIQRRLGNIEFEVGDMLSTEVSSREF